MVDVRDESDGILGSFKNNGYAIENTQQADLPELLKLEKLCWPKHLQITASELTHRIKQFPQGQFVIKIKNRVVAALYSQRISNVRDLYHVTYENVSKLHRPRGKIIQLLSISVSPKVQERGLGDQLVAFAFSQFNKMNRLQKILAVTRCKSYVENSHLSIEEYVEKHNEYPEGIDPILRFHTNRGARITAILPNYRPEDKDNRGAGILVEYNLDHNVITVVNSCIAGLISKKYLKNYSVDRPLKELGFDSLALLELRVSLNQRLGLQLDSTFFFQYSTPAAISQYLQQNNSQEKLPKVKKTASQEVHEPIAIISMSCRFPGGINTISDFWELLKNSRDVVTTVPRVREGIEEIKYGGFLNDVDQFDADFFHISAREAELMDPQQRILLETTWEAFETAGICADKLVGTKTGVFVGIFSHDYETLLTKNKNKEDFDAHYATGNSISVSAGRLSYVLGLQGPAMAINTACSSSLVAVHLACQSLWQNESHLAIAAGVNLILSSELSMTFAKAGMLSPDGKCKTFDASANGYVRSEGCGVLILKKLSQAITDNDTILALIRGSAVNQDGASNGLTAPNKAAQEILLHDALSSANVPANSISYVEAHGTGTALGDPIEVKALAEVYNVGRAKENPLILGSVKTNIGHTEAVAGIAGLIKSILALEHGKIPANLHFSKLNPHIDLDPNSILIPTTLIPWPTHQEYPRRAAVSSFGFSGTNAHVVIEEAPILSEPIVEERKSAYLITLSAKTKSSLKQKIVDLQNWLNSREGLSLADISYTLNIGRNHFEKRIAIVASSIKELKENLRKAQEGIYKPKDSTDEYRNSLYNLASGYAKGESLDWDQLYQGELRRRIALPTYPFAKNQHWFDRYEATKLSLKGISNTNEISLVDKLSIPTLSADVVPASDQKAIIDTVKQLLAETLYVDKEQLQQDENFVELGLDSILSVEFIKNINRKFNLNLTTTALYDHPTLLQLSNYLASQLTINIEPVRSVKVGLPQNISNTDIAIIGVSGRFPGANNVEDFWENLASGKSSITEIPTERWSIEQFYDADSTKPNKSYCKWGGFLSNADEFDPLFFNISPADAELMDPQQRLFLEECWKTFEDAGYSPNTLAGKKCGVFVGVGVGDYDQRIKMSNLNAYSQSLIGTNNSILSARISYLLDLKGPSVAIDTACSSSLVAVHQACLSIWNNETEIALAGGVCVLTTPDMHIMTSKAGMLSKEGKCKTFDHSADGFVPGEGIGVILLKPLKKAIEDNDLIYAVIKGSGTNQDGKTNGITAPSAKSQTELELEVYQRFNIDPKTISYVEAHGTGTKLGDPIEVDALTHAFKSYTDKKQYCAIGAVKANIGHALTAAGITSVIKMILCLKHKKLVPMINFTKENEQINFKDTPFYVNTQLKDWEVELGVPKRAVISSFGFSGTNAHLVIEEAPVVENIESQQKSGYLIALSAKTEYSLKQKINDLDRWLVKQKEEVTLEKISYTLNTGRSHFEKRIAMVASSIEELKLILLQVQQGNYKQEDPTDEYRKHLYGLANDYVKGESIDWERLHKSDSKRNISLPTYPFAKERYWIQINSLQLTETHVVNLHPFIDANLSTLETGYFTKLLTGKEFYLSDHRIKDALVLPGVAYLELARAAGALAIPQQHVVSLRNITWMQPIKLVDNNPYTMMISLYPSASEINFEITNFKSTINSIEKNTEKTEPLLHAQGKIIYASVQIPKQELLVLDIIAIKQRCTQQQTAEAVYSMLAARGALLGPSFQVIQNWFCNKQEVFAELKLPAHLERDANSFYLHPVILDGAVQAAIAFLVFGNRPLHLPFGIGQLDIYGSLPAHCCAYIKMTAGQDNTILPKFLIQIIDENGKVLVDIKDFSVRSSLLDFSETYYYKPVWERSALVETNGIREQRTNFVLVFDDEDKIISILQEKFSRDTLFHVKAGDSYKIINENCYQINKKQVDDYVCLLKDLAVKNLLPLYILYRAQLPDKSKVSNSVIHDQLQQCYYPLFYLSQALGQQRLEEETQLLWVNEFTNNKVSIFAEALSGLMKTVTLEYPKVICRRIDVPNLKAQGIECLAQELNINDIEVRYDKNYIRHVKRYQEITYSPESYTSAIFKQNGVYFISGGAGGLGLIVAEHLTKIYQAKLILMGRSKLTKEQTNRLKIFSEGSAEIIYECGDVSIRDDVERVLNVGRARFGVIQGVIHCAGVVRDAFIAKKTLHQINEVFAPKIYGTTYLDELTQLDSLDCFVLFSSIASIFGNVGQCDYAYANSFMDAFAISREESRKQNKRNGKTISINWPIWADGGMKTDRATQQWLEKTFGIQPLPTTDGIDAFINTLNHSTTQQVVLFGQKQKLMYQLERLSSSQKQVTQTFDDANLSANDCVLLEKIRAYLITMAGDLLKIDAGKLKLEKELSNYGVDSIAFTKISNQLNKYYGFDLTPATLFEYPTLAGLAQFLVKNYRVQLEKYYQISSKKGEGLVKHESSQPISQRSSIFTPRLTAIANSVPASPPADIAIIGMSGIFPGAIDLKQFWENLESGKDGIREIPKERWDWRDYSDKTKVRWGGFIEGIDQFDAPFFNISPREAELMDPQQRLFLQTVWHAVEDAGYAPTELSVNTGLFVGVSIQDFAELLQKTEISAHSSTGLMHSVVANRVSYFLNWKGPSEAVDTACSSALVAIHNAVKAIQAGDCELAVAGGVNVLLTPTLYISCSEAGMLSEEGKCKTFDESANGYVRGEGVGAILLKPLAKALAEGDHIYGVIKGSAVNHGGRVTSFTVPNPNAQADLLITAYKKAKIDIKTMSYMETHGTGTPLGDPIEVNGLKKAFSTLNEEFSSSSIKKTNYCGISTVKTYIGHLEAAAGIAGVIKVLLAMQHKKLPGTLNFKTLNPYIKLENSPFYVVEKTQGWEHLENEQGNIIPYRAGVSSFGFGGANAHIIIEEAPNKEISPSQAKPCYLITLSAKTENSLKQKITDLEKVINESYSIENISYTLNVGRNHFEKRCAIVANSIDELKSTLQYLKENKKVANAFLNTHNQRDSEDQAIFDELFKQLMHELKLLTQLSSDDYRNKLKALANFYVKGYDLDWGRLHHDESRSKISLPTYPFAKERYWIPENVSKKELEIQSLHPLLDTNISTLDKLAFSKELRIDHFYLNDHRVQGIAVLPGVAYLEMARAAASFISPEEKVVSLTHIIWAIPITVTDKKLAVISLYPTEKGLEFEVTTDEMHSQGKLHFASGRTKNILKNNLDLASIQSRCLESMKKEAIYAAFSSYGLNYGPTFQTIETLWYNEHEALAKLQLSSTLADTKTQWILHPSLLDGALQTVVGLLFANKLCALHLPFSLGELEILNNIPAELYAFAERKPSGNNIERFDIQLADEKGQVVARLYNFSIRALQEEMRTKEETNSQADSIPLSQLEKELLILCADELKIKEENLGTDTPLSEYGLDSLMMMMLLDQIEEKYGQSISASVFIEHDTIRSLAQYLLTLNIVASPKKVIIPTQTSKSIARRIVKNARVRANNKIAVIGMAGRFPSSPDLETYWENLSQGKDLIAEVPKFRWQGNDYYSEDKKAPHKSYSKWGGFIDNIDYFAADYFNVSADDAVMMDPQQRLLLELTQELLDRAGYKKEELNGKKVGVFIGGATSQYHQVYKEHITDNQHTHQIVNQIQNMQAARIADFYNLKGPALTVDTACSSSLVAIHQACQSIINGESDAVIAGGVETLIGPDAYINFSKASVLSDDGKCYVFDERAKGMVLGEGLGLVLLKSYDKAMEDGDTILGTILGSAINNDGHTAGITVPSPDAQKAVIQEALNKSNISAESISYYEAHGTGTLLGDPIEIKAMTEVYQQYSDQEGYCAVGSVKSNMGHLLRAAGVASFIKVLLAMQHKQIPATLHCENPHPRFNFKESPFYPVTQTIPWEERDEKRRAAISSFGFGGTNCHIILEAGETERVRQPLPLTLLSQGRYWLGEEVIEIKSSPAKKMTRIVSEVTPEKLFSVIAHYLTNKLAQLLSNKAITQEDLEDNIMDLGIDSTQLIMLAREIEQEAGIELYPTLFFEYQTIQDLSHYFAKEHTVAFSVLLKISLEMQSNVEFSRSSSRGLSAGSRNSKGFLDPADKPRDDEREKDEECDANDIAVIGMSGLFAGSPDLNSFWEHLKNKTDLITEIPQDHFDYKPWFDANPQTEDKLYCKWGSFLSDIDKFDAAFFNIAPFEAEVMDPQLRLLLQVLYATTEDAGYADRIRKTNTGMYIGACSHYYQQLINERGHAIVPHEGTGNAATMLANRPSFFFDLKGPSLAVDTACSSSLVALHIACTALKNKECDMAFVAGTNLILDSWHYRYFCSIGALSATGRCHTFDNKADGYVPGEGIAAVLLKPLKKALKDNDQIHTVIKGTAINHGGYTPSVTAPSVTQEAEVILKAWNAAKIDPSTMSYIEAHGTGTKLGDPVEIQAIKKAFAEYQITEEKICAIGSAKAHIGHTEAVAGIAGLIKVILSMKHRQIPVMPFFKELNPYIDLKDSPLYINREMEEWVSSDNLPRRAGVSSFGMGGAYAHVVLEEAPVRDLSHTNTKLCYLITLSAKTESSLRQKIADLENELSKKSCSLEDMSYTLNAGRSHFEKRCAIAASSIAELQESLQQLKENKKPANAFLQIAKKENSDDQAIFDEVFKYLVRDLDDVSTLSAEEYLNKLRALANYYVKGYDLDWERLHKGESQRKISLPTYPFDKKRYWISLGSQEIKSFTSALGQLPGYCLLEKQWQVSLLESPQKETISGNFLVLANNAIISTLQERLSCLSLDLIFIQKEDLLGEKNTRKQAQSLLQAKKDLAGILDFSTIGLNELSINEIDQIAFYQTIIKGKSDNLFHLLHFTTSHLNGAVMRGLVRMLGGEYRHLNTRTIEIESIDDISLIVLNELSLKQTLSEIRYQSGKRYTPYFKTLIEETDITNKIANHFLPIHVEKVYVITGGTRGIGMAMAQYFAERGAKQLVLMGLEKLPERKEWDAILYEKETTSLQQKIVNIHILEKQGVKVKLYAGSLTDKEKLSTFFIEVRNQLGEIGGILHCAGLVNNTHPAFINKEMHEIKTVCEPKINGLLTLHQIFKEKNLDFFILFSSVSGQVPALGVGMSDYSMANSFMDDFAAFQVSQGHIYYRSFAWPSWKDVGMGEVKSLAYRQLGLLSHTTAEGCYLLEKAFSLQGSPCLIPALVDKNVFSADNLFSLNYLKPQAAINSNQNDVLSWLVELFSQELKIPVVELKPTALFNEFGVDSILLAELVKKIEKVLDIKLDPSILLEYPTLASLSGYLQGAEPRFLLRVENKTYSISSKQPIAVIGIACHFPDAPTAEDFWKNLKEGRLSIHEVPALRWKKEEFYHPTYQAGKSISQWGGFIEGIDWFDPGYFCIQPQDAAQVDPLARQFLEVSAEVLCDAGYEKEALWNKKVGVFVGSRSANYADRIEVLRKNTIVGVGQNFIAAHVSHFFNFKGPSLVIDTACSSSLVSVHMACQSLLSGECEVALAGGVDILLDEKVYLTLCEAQALSSDGKCYTFDERANGFVPGEGAGVVLLKPLDRAIHDGDRIYAVIEGSAVNNDGNTMGITTPNPEAQRSVIEEVLQKAAIHPETISYIEAHGTGTLIGDPIELKALTTVFQNKTEKKEFCAVGSVKSNIGHTLSAAGIASFIKVALSLHHKQLVPTLHCKTPNPRFNFKESPFYLNTDLKDWEPIQGVRRSGISSFGFGGTNVHCVLRDIDNSLQKDSKRISLLPIVFNRQRYWLEKEIKKIKETSFDTFFEKTIFINEAEKKQFSVILHYDNYIVRDHRVHGIRVLPGVVFLDMVYRLLKDSFANQHIILKNILFKEPIVVTEEFDKKIILTLTKETTHWQVKITSQKIKENKLLEEKDAAIAECELHLEEEKTHKSLDIESLKQAALSTIDLETVYQSARGVEIVHDVFMKSQGKIYQLPDVILMEVHLSDLARSYLNQFYIHPVFLDTATFSIAVEINNQQDKPYIPFFIQSFYATQPVTEPCYVYAPHQKEFKQSDILRNDLTAYNGRGELLFSMDQLTVKRIRAKELISQLGKIENNAKSEVILLPPKKIKQVDLSDPMQERAAVELTELVALQLKKSPTEIDQTAAFYDLGLNSKQLLEIELELETSLGCELYPTLLFEYTTIQELAGYLTKQHGSRYAPKETKNVAASIILPKKVKTISEVKSQNDDIAIIGLAGRYPGADTLSEFWENIREGKNCITEIPEDHWQVKDYFDPIKNTSGKTYSKWGGFIRDIDKFDPLFFRISPAEAIRLDPQLRILLEVAWHTIEDAGYTPLHLAKQRVGVYMGVMNDDFTWLAAEHYAKEDQYVSSGSYAHELANRISYFMNFQGPSLTLETACSSSLTAIHMARMAILHNECDMALAGGVNLSLHRSKYLMLSNLNILSAEGKEKTFDEKADGYVPGEGAGAVLLKRLSQAIEDGDSIYGVIKSSAINHSGTGSGQYVPNIKALTQIVEQCIEQSGIDAEEITYIESHGTGTNLGDPIELRALANALEAYTQKKQYCALGSKANLGHMEAASGVCSLTKILLSMKHHILPPCVNLENANPAFPIDTSPFFIPREQYSWKSDKRRIAGVNSFGLGGSNAFMLIEEYEEIRSQESDIKPCYLITLSAKTENSLKQKIIDLENCLEKTASLKDISYTLNVGRTHFERREAIVASSIEELRTNLQQVQTGNYKPDHSPYEYRNHLYQIANAYVKGHTVDWEQLHLGEAKKRISLPPYPFEKERYWISDGTSKTFFSKHEEKAAVTHQAMISDDAALSKKVSMQILKIVSELLAIKVENLDLAQDFSEYGVDSIAIMSLINKINTCFNLTLAPSILFEYSTLTGLTNYLITNYSEQLEKFDFAKISPNALSDETTIHGDQIVSSSDLQSIEKYVENLVYPRFIKRITKSITKLTLLGFSKFFIRVTVQGIEHLPKDESFIICANHSSYLDVPSIYVSLNEIGACHKFVGLGAEDYNFHKSKFFALIGDVLPFDRTGNEYALYKNLKYIELCKKANKILMLFPEGTRSENGELQQFKHGTAWFAQQTDLKIIPAYIEGTHRLMPKGRIFPRAGKITVTFGQPLHIDEDGIEKSNIIQFHQYQHFTQKLRLAILKLKNGLQKEFYEKY